MSSATIQDEMTYSSLKLVMHASLNKLEGFRNSLHTSGCMPASNPIDTHPNSSSAYNTEGRQKSTHLRRTANSLSPSNRLYRIMVILKIAKKARAMLMSQQAEVSSSDLNQTPSTHQPDSKVNLISDTHNTATQHVDLSQSCSEFESSVGCTTLPTFNARKRDHDPSSSNVTTVTPIDSKRLCFGQDSKDAEITSSICLSSTCHSTRFADKLYHTTENRETSSTQKLSDSFALINNTKTECVKSNQFCTIDPNTTKDASVSQSSTSSSPTTALVDNATDEYPRHFSINQIPHHDSNMCLCSSQSTGNAISHPTRPLITGIN